MDDPLLQYAESLANRNRQEPQTGGDDPLVAYATQRSGQRRMDQRKPERMGKGEATLTALVSAVPGVEAIGGALGMLGGRSYQEGRRAIARQQEAARESLGGLGYEGIRLAPEIAAFSALAPFTGGATAPLAATRIGRVMQAAKRVVPEMTRTMGGRAGLAGGIEAVRGASRAGIQEEQAPTVAETLRGAGRGLVAGTTGSLVGEGLVRGGVGLGTGFRKWISEGASSVPGTGVIPRAQQAIADVARRGGLNRAAEVIEPIGPQRAARVLREELPTPQSAAEFRVEAQRIADEGSARARQSVAEATERLKASVPREVTTNADELRDIIRTTQREAGDASYARAFELADGVDFSPVARQVEAVVRRNPEVAAAYRDAFTRGGAQEAGEDVLPALDLPTFDRMRQNINERAQAFLRGDPTGVPRARASEAFADIKALEDAYVNRIREVRGDEAATALREARAEYAEYFRQLDALSDGRNLGRFGFGKREGRIEPNRLNITNLERQLENVSPEARDAFQVGAREWVNDVIRRTPEDARRVASNLVGTEERFRRTVLALGPEVAEDLRVVFRDTQQVRESARRGLQVAREQARGGVAKARTDAQIQADIVRAETNDARRQVVRDRNTFLKRIMQESPDVASARQARDVSRQMSLARAAVGDADAALGFANAVVPRLTPEARIAAGRVMATRIDDEVMGLMTKANGAQLVADRFEQLRQNPATNAILGRALEEAQRRLRAGVPLRRPVGAVFGAGIGGSLASNR